MLFSSTIFLFGFLPLFLALYYLTPGRVRNFTALLGSLVFYGWGEPIFMLVLVASSAVDYWISHRIAGSSLVRKRVWLLASLVVNFGLLGYFKYANFAVAQAVALVPPLESWGDTWKQVALPIGISFFTFQKVSYVVDVFRGTVAPSRRFVDFTLYVTLFPQLIAGPIVRYHDVNEQLSTRTHTLDRFLQGSVRLFIGLGKKVLIANQMAYVADTILNQPMASINTPYAWLGILAYTLQIYFDFSGYSDMAIGLGKMMGFEFLENFNRPYTSRSITEFWRRWHISLSNWMLEYLYIPLGGSRVIKWRAALNLWIVFLFSGFWHGASWSFVVWGAYHGFFLSLERIVGHKRIEKIPAIPANILTLLLVVIGWVFFRMESLPDAFALIGRMFAFDFGFPAAAPDLAKTMTHRSLVVFALGWGISLWAWQRLPARREFRLPVTFPGFAAIGFAIIVAILSFANLVGSGYNPFIYFRF